MKKIVHHYEYCDKCKHKNLPDKEEPCNECLTIICREDSHKPINFEEGKKDDKN